MWRVLVVDDEEANRRLLIEILKDRAECKTATNGQEALEVYDRAVKENSRFDIILLDIAMPGMDGMEVLKKIRGAEADAGIKLGEGIPIIMVTAYKTPFLEAFDAGCDDYIIKPINPKTLIAKIEEKVETRRT